MHAHKIVNEFERLFPNAAVEYALHSGDVTLDRIAVHVEEWPEWAVYKDTYRLLSTLRALDAEMGDAAVCAAIEYAGCLRKTDSLKTLEAEGWEVYED